MKTSDLDTTDVLDADVIDAPEAPRHSGALVVPKKGRRSVVPYEKKTQLPAVIATPLGDLDAFIRAANAAPLLTAEEEKKYAVALRDKGDVNAAQALVISHLRLVISVARGYLGYGLPHADLIQEGNIGLMKAIKHFDPDRGVRLMTFAVHWIRAEIQDYVVKNWRLVKLATTKNQRKLFFNLRQMKESDKALTYGEAQKIAETLEVKPQEVLDMEERMTGGETSIDGPVNDDDDNPTFSPIDWLSRDEDGPMHQWKPSHGKNSLGKASKKRWTPWMSVLGASLRPGGLRRMLRTTRPPRRCRNSPPNSAFPPNASVKLKKRRFSPCVRP